MSIEYRILGGCQRDNALLLKVDSGQRVDTMMFDCGAGCVEQIERADIRQIKHLFFSHLHMDHVVGFDIFFRFAFKTDKPHWIWGPRETCRIMRNRFNGFIWNLIPPDHPGCWFVNDVTLDGIEQHRFDTCENFSQAHVVSCTPFRRIIIDDKAFQVETWQRDHIIPSLAYLVREKERRNIDTEQLAKLDLPPGRWLKDVKDMNYPDSGTIDVDGKTYTLGMLREQLMHTAQGQSLAYMTDCLLDEQAREEMIPAIDGCNTLICESQYLHEDLERARQTHHMTVRQVAQLARDANVDKLILFHLSERYKEDEIPRFLEEARAIFPNTHFPEDW